MELPLKFSFEVKMTYNGKELTSITNESDIEAIKNFDPHFEERRECRNKILKELLNPFSLFLHKYPILKAVIHNKFSPQNVTFLNLLEDAMKQNVTDLSDIMTSFIKFLEECKGKFQILFKKKAQHKLIEAIINKTAPDKQEILLERNREIDLKRESLFIKFNSKQTPSDQSFDLLKTQVDFLRKEVRTYRDKVAAHNDEIQPSISWEDLDEKIEQFKNLITNFYTVLSFEMALGEAQGPGLLEQQTSKLLIEAIYS
jgi:hypothetical protein